MLQLWWMCVVDSFSIVVVVVFPVSFFLLSRGLLTSLSLFFFLNFCFADPRFVFARKAGSSTWRIIEDREPRGTVAWSQETRPLQPEGSRTIYIDRDLLSSQPLLPPPPPPCRGVIGRNPWSLDSRGYSNNCSLGNGWPRVTHPPPPCTSFDPFDQYIYRRSSPLLSHFIYHLSSHLIPCVFVV
ncbi:hypothetical protein CC2G_005055 [Coprinopsis cinerea AmutBmut pab1-1]|nr:hypothetical protein CC2G_005055 [Coprinopsis cinerea AmutBmut pab1-1]